MKKKTINEHLSVLKSKKSDSKSLKASPYLSLSLDLTIFFLNNINKN